MPAPAAAQPAAKPSDEKPAADAAKGDTPINITSDHMEADDKEKIIIFTGNVIARQKDMTVHCDEMTVYYREVEEPPEANAETGDKAKPEAEKPKAEADPEAAADTAEAPNAEPENNTRTEVVRIVAMGNVKITQQDRIALSNKAVYEAKAVPRAVVLTGEPRIWRNKDFLTGRRITFYLDDGRSIVEGGEDKRVNAIFYQGSGEAMSIPAPGPKAGN